MPIIHWAVSDAWSHKVGSAQQQSIITWKGYTWDWAGAGPEGTSQFHKEVVQMPIVPTPASPPSLCQPHGEFPLMRWQRMRRLRPSLWWSCITQVPPEWRPVALHPLSKTSQKSSGEGQSFQGPELWAVHLCVHWALEKWPDMCFHTN